MKRVATAASLIFAVTAGLLVGVSGAVAAPVVATPGASREMAAADTSQFLAGYIISDQLFYDGNAMTAAQIQGFLDAKIGTCTNGRCLNVATVNYPGRDAYISTRTGGTVCNAIAGGTMKISELIYRTQVACGISAKVILVTLQKEQGLVTKKAPDDWALGHAMGMACPDTAPCDPNFAGLARQIVSGTAQLNCYKVCNFAKQPGSQYIQYSPDPSCGGTTLVVQNYATAALYSYTPYQPNAAALAAGYGGGNDCSSHGNRNFWLYYNDWFGTSLGGSPTDAIKSLQLVLGGNTGSLGTVVTAPACASDAGTCVWTYQHGVISYNRRTGPIAASGSVGDYWLANQAALGLPTVAENPVEDPHGNGLVQGFARGTLHSSPLGTYLVPAGMMPAYSAAGWLRGSIGWPTSAPVCGGVANGCIQTFQGGTASETSTSGSFMRSDVVTLYRSLGSQTGSLGFPTTIQTSVTDPNGNGVVQGFETGVVHASSRGAFVVPTAVMSTFAANGWVRGSLGWPTAAEVCDAASCSQTFAGGVILVPTGQPGLVVAPVTNAAIRTFYTANSSLTGVPTGKVTMVTDPNGDGAVQAFQKGIVHSGPSGTFLVPSEVMPTYSAAGWLRGSLGWPTAAAACDATGCTQPFAGGTVKVPTGQAGFVVVTVTNPAIKTFYDANGGAAGPMGLPLVKQTNVTDPNGNGVVQSFQNGVVHSSAAGTFLVPTSVMSVYASRGWLRGPLGWPTAAAVCDAGGCVQQFQHGSVDTH